MSVTLKNSFTSAYGLYFPRQVYFQMMTQWKWVIRKGTKYEKNICSALRKMREKSGSVQMTNPLYIQGEALRLRRLSSSLMRDSDVIPQQSPRHWRAPKTLFLAIPDASSPSSPSRRKRFQSKRRWFLSTATAWKKSAFDPTAKCAVRRTFVSGWTHIIFSVQ